MVESAAVTAYYNENEPYAAAWLRNLIAAGHIAPGHVDERSIVDVAPGDLAGYSQCHLFAGLGGWSYALRLADWPDDKPVWTGSCPCQPFSGAGQQRGTADDRHLWPEFRRLVEQHRPATVFGEQVASSLGRAWLSTVRADLEALEYVVGAADLCAASVGAPHIRQRLWFVADSRRQGRRQECAIHDRGGSGSGTEGVDERFEHGGAVSLADSSSPRLEGRDARSMGRECATVERGGEIGTMADACSVSIAARTLERGCAVVEAVTRSTKLRSSGDAWRDTEWLPCRDGKARPTQPGIQPLAHGVSARVGKLRAAGNAIVPQVAAEFIAAYLECRP
jgi:DNA (cytosine-5)-methyltransferase 1